MTNRLTIRGFRKDERGATAIKYGLIVGIMSLVVVAIAGTGGALDGIYTKVSEIISAMVG